MLRLTTIALLTIAGIATAQQAQAQSYYTYPTYGGGPMTIAPQSQGGGTYYTYPTWP